MNSTTLPAPRRRRSRRRLVVTVLLLLAALLTVVVVQQSLATASAAVPRAGVTSEQPTDEAAQPASPPSGAAGGSVFAPSEADGVIRDGDQPTVFDTHRVAVGQLDPALLDAVQRAASDAAQDGVEFRVNSGWRSAVLQDRMLQDAVVHYGSVDEAARWVATPETSLHVSGDAVDLGPLPVQDWLAQHGAGYGLCQIYANEPWHYELRPDAVADGCPQMYADPTEDPRMRP